MQRCRLDIDLLLSTATAQFAALGFEALSMRALAAKCAVTEPAIYYHFSSKEALYSEVCSRRFADIAQIVERRVASVPSAEGKFVEFISAIFDEWEQDPTILLLSQREVITSLTDPGRCVAGTQTKYLFGLIENILKRYFGGASQDAAFSIGSLLFGYCSLASLDTGMNNSDGARSRDQRKQVLIDLSLRMLHSMPGL